MNITITALAVLLLAPLVAAADPLPAPEPGAIVLRVTPLPEGVVLKPGVEHPQMIIFRTDPNGTPILSEAGYVALADEGDAFYYGRLVPNVRKHAEALGIIGTNNWGDVEAMALAASAVRTWHALHPDVRLGIDDISARFGGYHDYNEDEASDHLTHQGGMNFSFDLPCRQRPEVKIHVGRGRHEELFDAELMDDLIDVLVASGAHRLTTNAAFGLVEDEEKSAAWTEKVGGPDVPVSNYQNANGRTLMYLIAKPADHGDHINVLFWPGN